MLSAQPLHLFSALLLSLFAEENVAVMEAAAPFIYQIIKLLKS